MDSIMIDYGMALWLGILASISPCPLATNIAAISFIGRKLESRRYVFTAGILYMFGRTVVYTLLGAFLVSSVQAIPAVATFLQTYMNAIMGPFLFILGIVLLEVIPLPIGRGGGANSSIQTAAEKLGMFGALFLGILFALSFCPVTAAMFFGNLFSIAIKHQSRFFMPSLFGIGTALPVLGFAFVVAFSTNAVGQVFNKLSNFERWARRITAILFIAAGIYLSLKYTFKIL